MHDEAHDARGEDRVADLDVPAHPQALEPVELRRVDGRVERRRLVLGRLDKVGHEHGRVVEHLLVNGRHLGARRGRAGGLLVRWWRREGRGERELVRSSRVGGRGCEVCVAACVGRCARARAAGAKPRVVGRGGEKGEPGGWVDERRAPPHGSTRRWTSARGFRFGPCAELKPEQKAAQLVLSETRSLSLPFPPKPCSLSLSPAAQRARVADALCLQKTREADARSNEEGRGGIERKHNKQARRAVHRVEGGWV